MAYRWKLRSQNHRPGDAPGRLVYGGDGETDEAGKPAEVRVTLVEYNQNLCEDHELRDVETALASREDRDTITWINIDGLHRVDLVESIGKEFGLHPLVLEDILGTRQRPKIEVYEGYVFLVARFVSYDSENDRVMDDQFSLVVGDGWVLSFQERPGEAFKPVMERLQRGKGRIRTLGADYLGYALIDAVVDHYFVVLDKVGERVADLEEELVRDLNDDIFSRIHSIKREMIFLRRAVWPLRECLSALTRGESDLFSHETQLFLRDVHDHAVQVVDTVETYRDMLSSLMDLYLSSLNNRMDAVMKVLTIIATIFIPLTFIAGVYGMNFQYMPELTWRYGYPAVWAVMIVIAGGMLFYFKRKNWL